jgi:hypothetical protein
LGRLLGAVEEDLVPVDAVQALVAFGQLVPGGTEAVEIQPTLEAALAGFVAGEAAGQILPGNPGDQDIQQAVQAASVADRLAAVALPHHGWQDRLKDGPYLIGDAPHAVGQLHSWILQGLQL